MAEEPDNHTLRLLREMREEIATGFATVAKVPERMEKAEATMARMHADVTRTLGQMHVDLMSVHTDVLEAKAVSREVAVRLTLIEKRSADMEGKIDLLREDVDAIKKHVGLVKA